MLPIRRAEEGAAATEYVLVVFLVALAILIAVGVYGETLGLNWSTTSSSVDAALD